MHGHDLRALKDGERGPHRGLPGRTAFDDGRRHGEPLEARLGGVRVPRRRRDHDRRDRGGCRGGRRGHGQHRPVTDPEEGFRHLAAEPAADARSEDHGCGLCVGIHARSMADGPEGRMRYEAAGAVASSVAKIIRPVVVWITLRTRAATWEPIALVASSTTTIVPSSR